MGKLQKIITKEEFEKVFAYILKQKKPKYKRYALATLLGFEAGMRISEIIGLKYKGSEDWDIPPLTKDRVDMQLNSIRVEQGKGGKDRIVPLPKRFNMKAYNMLALNIKRRTLQNYFTETAKKVLEKDISFHTLRAGFITHCLNEGVPVHQVQLLVGHSRMDTTGGYARANPKEALERARDVF